MFRKPWFWAVFTLVSVLCTAWAVMNFARAFPLVTLNVTMDRAAAMAAAEELATDREWGPSEPARQAVQFSLDTRSRALSSSRPAARKPIPRCSPATSTPPTPGECAASARARPTRR